MVYRVIRGALISQVLAFLAGLVGACVTVPPTSQPSPSPAAQVQTTASAPAPLPSWATPSPIPATTPTPTAPTFQACSPLLGIAAQGLSGMIANPYDPPPLGSDDPHQGIDLAQVQNGIARSGLPVQAVLPGAVVMVVTGSFPYGNAMLVETPLEDLPAAWLEAMDLPAVPATPEKRTALTCPTPATPVTLNFKKRSLYLLYAHLLETPPLKAEDRIECGQVIGAIGDSGNALNPHLHLEVRLGPEGVSFPGMAHYDSSASPDEMAAYCQWRVSGAFLTIDPLRLFAAPQP